MGHPPEPVDHNRDLGELEMIEKTTKRILDKSDTNIDPVKIVLAEITIEEKDNDSDRSQMQWNKVEIWESDAIPYNTSPSSQIEEGIDALNFNWLDIDGWSNEEILQEAKNCKLDKITDLESESEEEIFWDSLSQLDKKIEIVKGVNRDTSEIFMDDKKYKVNNGLLKKVWDNIYRFETFEDVPKLSKNNKIRKVRSRTEFIAKFILFSVIIGQVAIGKEIGGMVVQNKIENTGLGNTNGS